jgi:hypothetical protein
LTPEAVNVTLLPEQTELEDVVIDIVGVTLLVTISEIPLEVAVILDKQVGSIPPVERTVLITSPLVGA